MESVLTLKRIVWRIKALIADGRPFDAHEDIYHFALDAMLGFTFSHGFDYGTVRPTSEAISGLDVTTQKALRCTGTKEDLVSLPHGKLPDVT